jgi:hypothetical protein
MKKGRLMRPKMVAEMLITGFGRGVNEGKSEERWRRVGGRERALLRDGLAWAAYLRNKV